MGADDTTEGQAQPRHFQTTHWSIVLAARGGLGGSADARAAIAELCRVYWYPVYGFIRHRRSAEQAADLTQEFFARLLEQDSFAAVDRSRGRFRSWLLAAVQNFLANDWHRATAQKRDFRKLLQFDAMSAEQRYLLEPRHEISPERLFDRRWALCFLTHVQETLRAGCEVRGRAEVFDRLRGFLPGGPGGALDEERYERVGAPLGLSANAVKQELHRLRGRYAETFQREMSALIERPEDMRDELRFILAALDGPES
jgi:RNA polymerase sigma-70 factor (ECF subfamily)